jgi:hypothetical protein
MKPHELINKHLSPINHAGTDAISEVQLLADIAYIGLHAAEILALTGGGWLDKMQEAINRYNKQGD